MSRVTKSLKNAKVNLLFYFLSLFFAFFSRKIFLDCLGAEFIGLTGTLGNILGYLNLAELGIGTAVSVFLYKPLEQKNYEKLNELISLFGYLYQQIGLVILCFGAVVSLFFPFIFAQVEGGLFIVYFAFYSYLFSVLLGYFLNYKQLLLTADQKNYLVAVYFQSAGFVRIALQIALAYHYKNLYLFVAVETLFSVIGCLVLNRKIDREYPWLQSRKSTGRQLLKQYPEILKNTKRVFIHKLKDFLLGRSDELFVFAFVSLKMVAYYGNYTMIITKISLLFQSMLDGVSAGVGNLVAEGNREKMLTVFWELMVIRHFIAGLLCFSIYFLLEPFITLWLGSEYVLSHFILILLVAYLYIQQSRGAVDMFNHAHGLYADTWSAWVEMVLNIGFTLLLAFKFEIAGILLGKLISLTAIVIWWKPYYLFRNGFLLPILGYWNYNIRYYIIFILSFGGAAWLGSLLPIDPTENFLSLLLYACSMVGIYLLFNIPLLYVWAAGTKSCFLRFKNYRK
ncbi:MAG: lipopolysaccharide biosynthesis protein [Phocaeicola sp.]